MRITPTRPTLITLTALLVPLVCQAQTITTFAGGNPDSLGDGGPATKANLVEPTAVAFDSAGNLYIADYMQNRIRKVSLDGTISTVAGNGTQDSTGDGGPATSAAIHLPWGLAVDNAGNIYFAERVKNKVRRVSPAGIINTIAGTGTPGFSGDGGPADHAQIYNPFGLAVDTAGNLYIADTVNQRIRMVNTKGIISTVAGRGTVSAIGDGGPAVNAGLSSPAAVAFDAVGNLFIAEGNRIRKVNTSGIISTIAGNNSSGATGDGGPATSATLATPQGVIVDGLGNVFIADSFNNRIRKIDTGGIITTIAGGHIGAIGDGGPAVNANVAEPTGLALDCGGNLYLADTNHNLVRKIAAIASVGPAITAVLNGASLLPGITPNAWATVKGTCLASLTNTWDKAIVNGKLPVNLNDVAVTVAAKAGYVYYVSPTQINFVVPDIGFGPQQVVVTNGSLSSPPFSVTSTQYGPAFFAWPANQVVATRQDFTWAVKDGTFSGATTIAAKPGEVIILWGTGFGPTSPATPVGVQVPLDAIYSTPPPTVSVNNLPATVYGSALAPGNAALYQVAFQVPTSLADGDWPVVATIGGAQSPSIVLSVKK